MAQVRRACWRKTRWFVVGVAVSFTPVVVNAACLNNTVEFANDIVDGSYFHLQKIRTHIQPQALYISSDSENWVGESVRVTPGSQLKLNYAPAWSIEVHYASEAIDSMGRWKHSALTGNRYAVLHGKHVPTGVSVENPPTFENQTNTHLSQQHADRAREWSALNTHTRAILQDQLDPVVEGYGKLTDESAPDKVVAKLSKWIKNRRLVELMDGRSNVDGAIHPVDFISQPASYCQGAASTLAMMAAQLGVPARLGETQDHSWVEVFVNGQWRFVENQPETFLDVMHPAIPVWTYPQNGRERRGYQPKSAYAYNDALSREALMSAALIDIIADPGAFGFVDGNNRYSWFFDWSNPFVYNEQGEVLNGSSAMAVRPEVYSDSVFNYYTCDYTNKHNSSQCGGDGRQFQFGHWYNSQWELAALYPGRENDLPYVFAKDAGDDTHVMYLTPIRANHATNDSLEQSKVVAGNRVRQQFYLSDKQNIKAVYGVLYLGADDKTDYTIPNDGGGWYVSLNGQKHYLRHLNGMSTSDGQSDGVQRNYLGLGQTVLRFAMDLEQLSSSHETCDG